MSLESYFRKNTDSGGLDHNFLSETVLVELKNSAAKIDSLLSKIDATESNIDDIGNEAEESNRKFSYLILVLFLVLLFDLFENLHINDLRINFMKKMNIASCNISEKQKKKYVKDWHTMKTMEDHDFLINEIKNNLNDLL